MIIRDLHIMVECALSIKGIRVGGARRIKRMCASKKSELHKDISTILTTYSRAGCDKAELPRPLPYHFPDHHARFVSSVFSSRERKTEINIF